jgi:hypothetical protein
MCDYSLHGLPNRLAREGEDLVAHRFSTGAIGLASPVELCRAMNAEKREKQSFWSAFRAAILPAAGAEVPAVCIPPGARLLLTGIPAGLRRELDVGPDEVVTFAQTSAMANAYHDAVRFANGRQVLLQFFREGQQVRVLSLGSAEAEESFYPQRIGAAV